MTQTQLNCFLLAAEMLNFSKTADKLYVSQPAVSKQISQLEDEFGFPLFIRTKNGLALTEAGELMFHHYSKAQQESFSVLEEAKSLHDKKTITIRVGCLGGWDLSHFYPRMKSHFSKEYPNYKLLLYGFSTPELLFALKRRHVDVIMTLGSSLLDFPEIQRSVLTRAGTILAFSKWHPLSEKPGIQLSDFRNEPFYTISDREWYAYTRMHIRAICMRHGFDPIIINQPGFTATLIKVQSEGGVLLVDDWMIVNSLPAYQKLQIDELSDICLGWKNDHLSESLTLFIEEMRSLFCETDP